MRSWEFAAGCLLLVGIGLALIPFHAKQERFTRANCGAAIIRVFRESAETSQSCLAEPPVALPPLCYIDAKDRVIVASSFLGAALVVEMAHAGVAVFRRRTRD